MSDTTSFPMSGGEGPEYRFTALTQTYRTQIVQLSADFNIPGAAYVNANTLELTALGANTDLLGQWDSPDINLVGWHHIAVTGRDVYVKIVTRGWMFPLGHEAVFVQIAERVVLPDPQNGSKYADAYVGLKSYVRIIQPTMSYPALGQLYGTNDWPFTTLTIKTTTSPELDPKLTELTTVVAGTTAGTAVAAGATGPDAQALLITYGGGQPVLWSLVATDLAGNELHLQAPLVFVNGYSSLDPSEFPSEFDETQTQRWLNPYNSNLAQSFRTVAGNGQPMRFAPEAGGPPGGTTHPVVNFVLGAATPSVDWNVNPPPDAPAAADVTTTTLQNAPQPAFYPILLSSSVRLKAADALSGSPQGFNDSTGNGVNIEFFPGYVTAGLPEGDPPDIPNNGVYAQLTDAVKNTAGPVLSFPSNLVGGLGSPNLAMAGLSAITGPVGGVLSDLQNYASGISDVTSYFNGISGGLGSLLPQLFGSLKLTDILGSFVNDLLPGGIPNLTVSTGDDGTVTVKYTLSANLQSFPSSDPIFVPQEDDGTFNLNATAVVSPTSTTYDVEGSISPFTIYLVSQNTLGFIEIPFNSFSFTSKSGTKTSVNVNVGSVTFTGALSFVNALQDFLSDLGGSGLSIDVTPTEVDASFSLSLPPVGVGVFSLSGIGFSTGVKVPFFNNPALVTFAFASQDNPFTLTVCMFGGGGFLALGIGFAGVETVQASFQFEGQFALDLGVASGGITLAAGVYYSYSALPGPNSGTTLTGFVRLTGEVEVLGIISVSAELDLSLTYHQSLNGSSYVQGTATLKVSISICFFSITVPITVTKQFSGGDPPSSMSAMVRPEIAGPMIDPPLSPPPVNQIYFDDVVPTQTVWQTYCGAFS
jgi:hypothetical protein